MNTPQHRGSSPWAHEFWRTNDADIMMATDEQREPFDLTGRGIVLTGGGGHLGRAMALALARAGATVCVMGRTPEPLRKVREDAGALAENIVISRGDVGRERDLLAAMEALEARGVALRGWVNNAYHGVSELLGELTREGLRKTFEGGVIDAMLATQLAAERMRAHGEGGAIVNIASMYGMVSPDPAAYAAHPAFHNPPAYGAAKAALLQFTRYAGVHYAPEGIRVNAISPGPFPNPSVQREKTFMAALERRVPMRRIGRPEELEGAVVFLLSDAASYMTGQNIVIDGGWTAW